MSVVTVKVSAETAKHIKMIKNMSKDVKKALRQGLYESGKDLKDTANQNIKKKKFGRKYKRPGSNRTYQASRPGESPANVSGRLRRSLNFKVKGSDQLEFGYDGVDYGEFLEKGTRNIKRRPALDIAVKANQRNIKINLENAIRKELTGK